MGAEGPSYELPENQKMSESSKSYPKMDDMFPSAKEYNVGTEPSDESSKSYPKMDDMFPNAITAGTESYNNKQNLDRALDLSGQIKNSVDINGSDSIQFKENSDGSETTISFSNKNFSSDFLTGSLDFVLKNVSENNGKQEKKFAISINSFGKMTVNGAKVTAEKGQMFLDKIEENFKEYKVKRETEEKEENEEKTDKMLASLDF